MSKGHEILWKERNKVRTPGPATPAARIALTDLTPLTVLLGPNGSGKSTVFDVFSFLSECFQSGLRQAWDKRGRFKELRTRGATGPIVVEIAYRLSPSEQPTTYHLAIDERTSPRAGAFRAYGRRAPAAPPQGRAL